MSQQIKRFSFHTNAEYVIKITVKRRQKCVTFGRYRYIKGLKASKKIKTIKWGRQFSGILSKSVARDGISRCIMTMVPATHKYMTRQTDRKAEKKSQRFNGICMTHLTGNAEQELIKTYLPVRVKLEVNF